MYRTHNCGELNISHVNQPIILCGWVQRIRDKGKMLWIDLRDRYGITQLIAEEGRSDKLIIDQMRALGREYVIKIEGQVIERVSKNPNIPTGEIEILLEKIFVLNESKLPPFTIEDNTDGGEEFRMKYRYLDIRRNIIKNNLLLRHRMAIEVRNYLNSNGFIEIETPFLISSTPEGARDFVVPSRMNHGEFYALPQSPQTFKQLLMIAGMDKYYQLVRCFRDEDLRADRQPEFTQIDCEMSFIEQEDILKVFEGLTKHLFQHILNLNINGIPRISYEDAMKYYGSDKPDLRFEMKFIEFNDIVKEKGFKVFDEAELVVGICATGCSGFSRKQLDELTEFVKKPQVGAKGLVYAKYEYNGTLKSSVGKFYSESDLKIWFQKSNADKGDLLLILAGDREKTLRSMSELRLEIGNILGLRKKDIFSPVWVIDFPLLEWDEETQRFYAKHHPFTAPKPEDIVFLDTDPAKVRANAYDLVINGVEIGGGSIRIFNRDIQEKMFAVLGFTPEKAREQFDFLMKAFEYGAPPHGGIAFGFDRWCALFAGCDSIRDVIAFPKNNAGRDLMINSPAPITQEQLTELGILLKGNSSS